MRKIFSSGAKWEDIVGYSRAVQVGNQLEVTGTVAVDEDGNLVGKNDFFKQTQFAIQKIEKVMKQAGFTLEDVVRTRIFVTDITHWEEVGKAHHQFFSTIKPATTMVEVKALIAPEYLVEIEVSAIKGKTVLYYSRLRSRVRMKTWLLYKQLPLLILSAVYSCRKEISQPIAQVESVQMVQDSTKVIDFDLDIVPILKSHCSPCHFPGGKMYEKMPFDKSKTIIDHSAGVSRRLKEQDLDKLKAYLDQESR